MNNVDWRIFPYDEEKKTNWTKSQLHPRVTITTSYSFTVLNSVDNQYSSTFHVIFYQEIVLNSTFLFCTLVTHSYTKPISYGKKRLSLLPYKETNQCVSETVVDAKKHKVSHNIKRF